MSVITLYSHPNSEWKIGSWDHDNASKIFIFKWAVKDITMQSCHRDYPTPTDINNGISIIEEIIAKEEAEKEEEWGHLFLYAKGWYEKSNNRIEDIKKVFGYLGMLYPEDIPDEHMCRVLTSIVYKYSTPDQFENVLMDAIGVKYQGYGAINDLQGTERFIRVMLSRLFEIKPKGKLPMPVTEVLPIKKNAKLDILKKQRGENE